MPLFCFFCVCVSLEKHENLFKEGYGIRTFSSEPFLVGSQGGCSRGADAEVWVLTAEPK